MPSLEAIVEKLVRGARLTLGEFEILWREAERRGSVVTIRVKHGVVRLDGFEVKLGPGGELRVRALGERRLRDTRSAAEPVEEA